MGSPYIKTRTGRKFFHATPAPTMVHLHDVAHALSNVCRFAGHTRTFFSVAQHSCEVAMRCYHLAPERKKFQAGLAGLMHDAHEAYIGDVSTPFKALLGPLFREAESLALDAVEDAFGIRELMEEHQELVRRADMEMLFSDAQRWGMDMLEINEKGLEVAGLRDWVPEDAEIFFPDAVPAKPGESYAEFISLFNFLGGPRYVTDPAVISGIPMLTRAAA